MSAGVISVAAAASWWLMFLSTIAVRPWTRDNPGAVFELILTILFFLPWAATIAGIVAIRRSKPHPALTPGDRRPFRGRLLGWTGVLAGAVVPFFLFAYAADQGL